MKALGIELTSKAWTCFIGMFNGCQNRGYLYPNDTLKIGKSECEDNWRTTWGELKEKGLIDWIEEPARNRDTRFVHLTITPKGYDWRQEDLRLWRERQDAEEPST